MARKKGIHPDHLNMLYRQLSVMTAAGMTVAEAIKVLAEEGDDSPARSVLAAMKSELAAGRRPGDVLSANFPYLKGLPPELFEKDPATAAEFFSSLADFSEKRQAMRRFLGLIFLYPGLVAAMLVAVISLLLIIVVPMLASMFSDMGGTLPLPTRVVITVSNFVQGWGGFLVLMALVTLIGMLIRNKRLRFALIDKLPVLRMLNRKIAAAELVRNLAMLTRAGVASQYSLSSAAASVSNEYFAGRFTDAARNSPGIAHCLSELRKEKLISSAVSHAARTGERSGTLTAVLHDSARFMEQDAEKTYDRFLVLLYPVTILLLGTIVGFCVIAMYMPIFQMGSMAG